MTTFANMYDDVITRVLEEGEQTSPRGLNTIEIIGAQIKVDDVSSDILPTGMGRGINPGIAVAEAAQLISGTSYPDVMVDRFPNFSGFTDGGVWFHGAYGPRIKRQIPKILETLSYEPSSRQAVITIWDPAYDGYGDVKDSPCTLTIQLLQRDNALHMIVNMRSNDVWWGLPYDVFQFTALQTELANVLGYRLGTYTHNAGSLHIYERDLDAIGKMTLREDDCKHFSWASMLPPSKLWFEAELRSKRIMSNTPKDLFDERNTAGLIHGK